MQSTIRECPDGCRYRVDDCDWMCRNEVNNFAQCPTIDKKWKRFAIGKFGEKIHAPRGVGIEEALRRYYQSPPTPEQTNQVQRKAALNLFDDDF